MNLSPITANDLDELRKLQPEGWPDIIPETEFYIRSSFCFPLKAQTEHCIAGMGAAIREQLLQMDKLITGENREPLLSLYMDESLLYVSDDALHGYYIPALKEGPVIANTQEAGLELMKIKCTASQRVVLPADNLVAIDFLGKNGSGSSSGMLRLRLPAGRQAQHTAAVKSQIPIPSAHTSSIQHPASSIFLIKYFLIY